MDTHDNKRRRIAAMDDDSPSALHRLVRGGQQYASANSEQLQELIQSEVTDLVEVTGVSSDEALLLLHCYGWKRQRLLEDWYDDVDRVKTKCGLFGDKKHIPAKGRSFYCEIQLEDFDSVDVDCAGCGHMFSKTGLQDHFCQTMAQNANNEKAGGGSLIRCPGEDGAQKCSHLFLPSQIEQILTPAQWRKYQDLSARNYAITASNVRFCPSPDCPWAIVSRDGGLAGSQAVQCREGHAPFCFRCGKVEHEPAKCTEVRDWEMKNDGGNATYLRENCKLCPKCNTAIERATGCNKVICSKCSTAFCWMCGQDFLKAHDYPREAWACNKPPATFSRDSKSEQARLLYFVDRVESTRQSADLAANLANNVTHIAAREKLQEKVAQGLGYAIASSAITDSTLRRSLGFMMEGGSLAKLPSAPGAAPLLAGEQPAEGTREGSSATTPDFLPNRSHSSGLEADATGMDWIPSTLSVVVQGRNVLKWAYVHTFFMASDQEQALFSEQQSHLEASVDKLQSMLETQAIINLLKGSPVLSDGTRAAASAASREQTRGEHVGKSTYVAPGTGAGAGAGGSGGSSSSTAGPAVMDDPSKSLVERYRDWKLRTLALAQAVRTARKQLFEGAQAGVLMETEYAIASSTAASSSSLAHAGLSTGIGAGGAGSGSVPAVEESSMLGSLGHALRQGVLSVFGMGSSSAADGEDRRADGEDSRGSAAIGPVEVAANASPSTIVAGQASTQEPVRLAPPAHHSQSGQDLESARLAPASSVHGPLTGGDAQVSGKSPAENEDDDDDEGSQGSFDYQYEDDE